MNVNVKLFDTSSTNASIKESIENLPPLPLGKALLAIYAADDTQMIQASLNPSAHDAVAFAIRSMEFHLTTQPAKSAQSILLLSKQRNTNKTRSEWLIQWMYDKFQTETIRQLSLLLCSTSPKQCLGAVLAVRRIVENLETLSKQRKSNALIVEVDDSNIFFPDDIVPKVLALGDFVPHLADIVESKSSKSNGNSDSPTLLTAQAAETAIIVIRAVTTAANQIEDAQTASFDLQTLEAAEARIRQKIENWPKVRRK